VQPGDNGPIGEDTGPPSIVGSPCTGNADCQSEEQGWCIDGKDGSVCTEACITDCPEGWTCKQVNLGGDDLTFACVPRHVTLCRPCKSNTDCTATGYESLAFCRSYGDAGSFCATPCGDNAPCPTGYECQQTQGPTGLTKACLRVGQECPCDNIAKTEALETFCYEGSSTCPGTRFCTSIGLSPCDVSVIPTNDPCNGLDDDCDGTTDEDFASFTTTCGVGACAVLGSTQCIDGKEVDVCTPKQGSSSDGCNGVDDDCDGTIDEDGKGGSCTLQNLYGSCPGTLACQGSESVCVGVEPNACGCGEVEAGCAIGAMCFQPGAVKPGNPCQVCDPSLSVTQWSSPEGQPCNDAKLCTYNDQCTAGTCAGTPIVCQDDACGLRSCNGSNACTVQPKGIPVYEKQNKGWSYGYAPQGVVAYRVVQQNQAVYLLSAPIPDKMQSIDPTEKNTCDWCGCAVNPGWCVYSNTGNTIYTSSNQQPGTVPLYRWKQGNPIQHRSATESPGNTFQSDQFLGYVCAP